MSILSTLRGHPIEFKDGEWKYIDTGESTVLTWRTRACGHCKQSETPEGHDACLGTLPGVRNACCGHGSSESAYVQFDAGTELRGLSAIEWFREQTMSTTPPLFDIAQGQ